jgi:glycosyltransferase involved in cell wall biosynthesis
VLGNAVSGGVISYLRSVADVDVVHAHSHLYFSTNVAALLHRLGDGKTPLAITNHGLYSQSAPQWVFRWYLRTLGRWTFNQADKAFCYTETDEQRLREYGVDVPVSVVSNGIDTERFSPDGPTSDRIDHEGPVLLFVGRLVEGKRPRDAVDALAGLSAGSNAKLYLAGDGPLRTAVSERAAERGVGERVELLGRVPYEEMPQVFRSADCLILPSRAEGLPRTVLEAFASGVPAVTSRLDQTREIVETAGRTVEVGDVDGYIAAIEAVMEQRASLGAAGRRLVVEDHQWTDTVAETTSCLESLR